MFASNGHLEAIFLHYKRRKHMGSRRLLATIAMGKMESGLVQDKEALLKEALLESLDARHEEVERALHEADVETVIRAYLSAEHRDAAGTGCPIAALASEVARHPRATRHTLATHNAPTLDALAAWLSARTGKAVARADAAALQGLLAGTLQLARTTPDRSESDAILEAGVRAALRLVT